MKDTTREDTYLLSAISQGDKKAFDVLFRKYYRMLCTYCYRFVDLQDAEEIVQDVLLWVWENPEVNSIIETSLSKYLFRMVYHRAITRIRQLNTKQRIDTLFYEQMQEMLQDIDFNSIEELRKRIEVAIAALPPTYREAFCMHRFEHLSYKEIATALNVSPKTVDYRIQQALKQLRVDLKDYLPLLLSILYVN